MNVDPSRLDIREYSALLQGWNATSDDEGDADYSRLKRAMDAHTVH